MKFEKCLKTTSKKALHRFTALTAVLFAVCLVFMTPAAAEAWDGTSVDTTWYNDESTEFTISTPAQLAGLAKLVNEGNGFNGKIIKLNADIDLSEKEWTPIGTDYDHSFKGTFDGNGKIITLTSVSSENTNVGLFGHISGDGVVKKLTISGTITVTTDKELAVGGIAGINQGTISSCYSAVTITATTTSINMANDVNSDGDSLAAGGLVGSNAGTIENCYSSGDVTATAQSVNALAGGIAGINTNKILHCYATGDVTVTSSAGFAGGLVGMNMQTLSKSFALNEKITADGNSNSIGRIAGQNLNLGSTSESYGYKHMQITPSSSSTENNVCAGAILSSGWSSDIWELSGNGNYKLPVLKGLSGQPTETLTHIDTVTVTFEANGGTHAPESQTILEGAKVTKPADLTDTNYGEGYTFGWYKEEQGTEAWNFETNSFCKDDTSKTLYAKWTPIQYTIKFNANGGEGTMDALPVNYDEEKHLTTNSFTKTGYTFAGWKSEDGTVTYSNGQTVKNLTSEPDEEVTLYAQWTANTYTVKFDANGGIGVMNDQTFTYDEEQPLAALNFTNGDKKFDGWATAADGEPVYADKATVKNLTAGANGVFNLYANWTDSPLPTYNVTFDSNGGSDVESQTVLSGQCATEPTTPTKTGYTFVGWENNSVAWNFADVVTQDITLVANWTANTYTVAFNANGGSGNMNPMSFTYGESQALAANAFIAPTSKVFNGWNTKADGSGTAYADKATVSDLTSENGVTVTLYAQWKSVSSGSGSHSTTKTTYTVTFNANGGEGEMFPQTFTSGKEKALNLNFFTREGYTFEGWATSADGDVVYTDGETIKVSKSMTLYAVWESNEPVNPQQPGDNPEQPGDEPENPEKPTEPETPAPILAVLAGLGAAVVLRRK